MFSLGAVQPQYILPVGHMASTWSTIRSVLRNKSAHTKPKDVKQVALAEDSKGSNILPELSYELTETLKELGLHHLGRDIELRSLNSLLRPATICNNEKSNWNMSDVSADSFYVNKHGFSVDQLLQANYSRFPNLPFVAIKVNGPFNISQTARLTTRLIPQSFSQQTRGFKTKRSSGYNSISHTTPGVKPRQMKDFIRGSVLGSINPQKVEVPTSDKLNQLLDHPNSTPEVQEKVKISFAEGYSAGQDSHTRSSPTSDHWSKKLYKMIAVAVIMFSVYYVAFPVFVALYSKSSRLNNIFADTGYMVKSDEVEERFEDVKGADEVKDELTDVVEFLRNPDRFTALGAKLPKGVLLCGPPGIGKTLLARAVAGEAGVPFIYASGSEFDEIFVGVGAKKIRDLFADAKNRAPCVIFLDEIDAVGSKRVNSETHPYANQTINQLLTEMDGFKQNEGIIILGATNRRDNLDKALMRPGRFDVEVHMHPPDFKGRKEIFQLYINKIKAGSDIDIDVLSRATSGYTGADIANVVNQAAIKAALSNKSTVAMADLEFARDKITMGPMKKMRIPDEETNRVTAFHEAGHTLVAYYTKHATSPHKVTIMPRGQSLGHTAFIPEKDQYNLTKQQLLAEMDVALGGRVAEELTFGTEKITTGAGSDFQKATNIAEALVKKLGMSEKAGLRIIEDKDFLHGSSPEYSAATMEIVDSEIKRLLQESYERCRVMLKSRQSELKKLSDALLKYETLDKNDIKTVLDGKPLTKKDMPTSQKSSNMLQPDANKKAIQAILEGTKLPGTINSGKHSPTGSTARTPNDAPKSL